MTTEIQKGSKVITIYGKIETVLSVNESQIITYESFRQNNWYHPTKVWPVFWSNNLQKYVTIPA